jgi:hypothetical protein
VDRRFEGGTGSFYAYSPAVERRPVKELYGVFRRPRNDADVRAGELAARWGALDYGFDERPRLTRISEEQWQRAQWQRAQLGIVVEAEGRLLLHGLGGETDMLYAAPTDNDCIAYALLPNGGGGCAAPGPDGLKVGWHQGEGGDLTVFGVVADAIDAVDLVLAGRAHEAHMGENAFGLRLERTHADDLERIVLRRRNGTTTEVALK